MANNKHAVYGQRRPSWLDSKDRRKLMTVAQEVEETL